MDVCEAMDAQTPPSSPVVKSTPQDGVLLVSFAGDWSVDTSRACELAIARVDWGNNATIVMDLAGVSMIDSSGAWIIHRERAHLEFSGRRVELKGVGERIDFLLNEIEQHIPQPDEPERRPFLVVRMLATIGRTMTMVGKDAVALVSILGVFGLRLVTAFTAFRKLRFTSILSNFERTCIGAVPIVLLMSFLIGLIIAQQGGFYLRTFGADLYVVDLSGVLILRELGVILAAILVAGRSGSAFTAEIGSMRMREEVDALHVLGLDPIEVLVVPRLIALMVALPVLTFLSDIAALIGALLITWAYLDITPDLFLQRLDEAVTPLEFYIGIAKAPFMALIIGLVACSEGLKVEGGAESLGRHTTSSVVKAIFLVILVDGLFAIFFATVGI